MLDTANKNTKSNSKKLDDLKTEVDSERRAELKRIEAEKRMKMEMMKRKRAAMPEKPAAEEKKVGDFDSFKVFGESYRG